MKSFSFEDVARKVMKSAATVMVAVGSKADVVKDNAVPFTAKHTATGLGKAGTMLLSLHDRVIKHAE